jgi:hypothetical protein
MAVLNGFYTDNRAVLFELERALTILEVEYHRNGQPLPPRIRPKAVTRKPEYHPALHRPWLN